MNTVVTGDANIRNIEWTTFGETVLNPLALLLTLIMIVFILVANRKYAIIPMLIVATVITNMQRVVIAGFDFDMLRLLIIGGMIRVILRNEFRSIRFTLIDKIVVIWLVIRFVAQMVLWHTTSRLVYNLGYSYNAVGMYFLIRMFIRDRDDVRVAIVSFIVTSIIVSIAMTNEQLTGNNVFGIFGGVPAHTLVREGRLRSQAAFSHPILAGSFGASVVPLAWGLLREGSRLRKIGIIGVLCGMVIVVTAASSGPVIAFMAAVFGIFMWRFQNYTRRLFWLGVLGLVTLNFFMNSPVYSLIWRVGVVGGSTGFHRYMLIDQAVKRFGEWWLVGTYSSAHWGWGLQDVTNMFIRQGIDSGFFGMLAFFAAIMASFKAVSILTATRPFDDSNKIVWALGVSLLAHTASFFGVSYFGQMMFFWYITIAMIASLWQHEAVPQGLRFYRGNSLSMEGLYARE